MPVDFALLAVAVAALGTPAALAQAGPTAEQIERECRQIYYYDECVRAGGYSNWSQQQSGQRSGSSGWTAEQQMYHPPADGGKSQTYDTSRYTAAPHGSSGWTAEQQMYHPPADGGKSQTYDTSRYTAAPHGSSGWTAEQQMYHPPKDGGKSQAYDTSRYTAAPHGSSGWTAEQQMYHPPADGAKSQTYDSSRYTSAPRGPSGISPENQLHHWPTGEPNSPLMMVGEFKRTDPRISSSAPQAIRDRRSFAEELGVDALQEPLQSFVQREAEKAFPGYAGQIRVLFRLNLAADLVQLFLVPVTVHAPTH
jgi:hypothetical protein